MRALTDGADHRRHLAAVRGPRSANPGDGGALKQYVNDRPCVASSFLSVAIAA